jgi:hypothetical protein
MMGSPGLHQPRGPGFLLLDSDQVRTSCWLHRRRAWGRDAQTRLDHGDVVRLDAVLGVRTRVRARQLVLARALIRPHQASVGLQ